MLGRVGAVAYRLQLPATLSRLHPVFHVGLLKQFSGEPPLARPPVFVQEDGEDFEVESLEGHRVVRGKAQFLVHWKGYPVFENTWEPEENLIGAKQLLNHYKESN